MTSLPPLSPDRNKILTLSKVLFGAFLLVAMSLIFWGALRSTSILARDDNPRRFEAERRIQRGALIDRSDTILAHNEGIMENQQRRYLLPAAGHGVGFYSMQHGTAGAEAGFDAYLRGESDRFWMEWWRQSLHLPQTGQDVQLALDYDWQERAAGMLGERVGAALLLEMPHDGEGRAWIRALVSAPGYDANMLAETFEALGADVDSPLLNRVTQGQYQPGLLLQPLILATAVEQGIVRLNEPVENPDRPVRVNGTSQRCAATPPDPATWADVLLYRCPGPMLDLADRLGVGGLDTAFDGFGLTRDPPLELVTETTPDQPLADALLAGIGQENLSVSPLQIGLAMAALAGNGSVPQAQIGQALRDEEGVWQPLRLAGETPPGVRAPTARAIRRALPETNGLIELNPVVLSGPEGSTNAWYVGMLPGETADFVAVVVLENNDRQAAAADLGRALLGATLSQP